MGTWFWTAAVVAAMLADDGAASAQSAFPAKPVHIFVPYAAGGGVDILARTLGDVVSRQWGQTVVVENRPGAGGVVASQALVSSPPDGYTLIVVASGHATNPFLYHKNPYDTFKDFTPISLLASSPNILLVRADSTFKTLGPGNMPPDLVAKLSHDFVAALNTDQVKERLGKLGAQPIGSSPQAFDAKIHADYEKWGPIIQAAGIKAE